MYYYPILELILDDWMIAKNNILEKFKYRFTDNKPDEKDKFPIIVYTIIGNLMITILFIWFGI